MRSIRPKRKYASAREAARKNRELVEVYGRRRSSRPRPKEPRGKAREFIEHLTDLLKRGEHRPVVLYCRETNYREEQERRLDDQLNDAVHRLRELGVTGNRLLKVFGCCGERGYMDEPRPTLIEAIKCARENNAILVAPTRCRLIRHHRYDGRSNSTERPTVAEYRRLLEIADGVPLATIQDPDDDKPKRIQIERGQSLGKDKGGRPKGSKTTKPGDKMRERLMNLAKVYWLKNLGFGYDRIAKKLGKPKSTVQGWWNQIRERGLPPEMSVETTDV